MTNTVYDFQKPSDISNFEKQMPRNVYKQNFAKFRGGGGGSGDELKIRRHPKPWWFNYIRV